MQCSAYCTESETHNSSQCIYLLWTLGRGGGVRAAWGLRHHESTHGMVPAQETIQIQNSNQDFYWTCITLAPS